MVVLFLFSRQHLLHTGCFHTNFRRDLPQRSILQRVVLCHIRTDHSPMTPCWDNLKIIAAWALVPILRLDENSTMGFDNGTAESVVRVVMAFWASSSVAYSTIPHPLDRPVLNSVMICACTYYLSSLSHVIPQCLPRQSPTQVPFGIIRCRNRQWMMNVITQAIPDISFVSRGGGDSSRNSSYWLRHHSMSESTMNLITPDIVESGYRR